MAAGLMGGAKSREKVSGRQGVQRNVENKQCVNVVNSISGRMVDSKRGAARRWGGLA